MKLGHNKYYCEWCNEVFNAVVRSVNLNNKQEGKNLNIPGRHTATAQLICPRCHRYVSQKTKEDLMIK